MSEQRNVVMIANKSVGASLVLTFLFGPLGMFYSTVWGGVIMTILCLLVGVFTLGLGLVVLWPICMVWGAVAVSNYNRTLILDNQ